MGLNFPCSPLFSHPVKQTKNAIKEKRFLFLVVSFLSPNGTFWLELFVF
ncbi:hypothetical protein B224_3012 [Aeromonas media WS]|nr:hypothetical protein B224_3012 [Aeromonas media WS]